MCKKLLVFVLMFGLASTAIGQPTGEILFEWWFDIGGTAISDLTGQASYPDNPDDGEMRTSFDGIVDGPDNYGTRVRGWLWPTDDGDYTFWISGDDYQELYLSTDDDPANAALIAQVPGWTGHLEWGKYPEQQSAPITLAAGGSYYIEALMKEGGGGDSIAVGWTGPGIGEDITVIDGAYLSPAEPSDSLKKAKDPVPADGAVDVDSGILEWGAGFNAASHTVYLNGELLGETAAGVELIAATLEPGQEYTWQVDETDVDGNTWKGDEWTFTTLPLEAHFPSPADGAENVPSPVTISWTAGKNTILNQVYFGTDEALVAARDPSTSKGQIPGTSVAIGDVELFTTYYWAVDEFTPPPAGLVAGPVWSFSTEKYVLIEDSITLEYDNTAEPYVSEAAIDTVADLTAGGQVSDLTLNFQGMGSNLSVDEETGTYTITGEGADIWGSSDAFHYVYMQLTGDGEISARVVSNGTGSNTWAKGGVMIRETNAPDSKHMIMAMTGGDGGGIAFQGRMETGGSSTSFHGDVTASPPYWVKLTREGNTITAYASADGETWDLFTDTSPDGGHTNPLDVEMADPVLIGLFVTSHADGENRTYVFDNLSISGDVDGVIVSEDIASVSGNSAEPVYVALEDVNGVVAMVTHPYPAATQVPNRAWRIPLSAFEGVDVTQAAKLYVGAGNGEPGGKGAVTFTDIKVVEALPAGLKDITALGDIVKGVPDDGDWPGAEHPALAIDDNTGTKFLHFKGDFDPDPNTGGTGIRVTPLDGPSNITGLSFTTANDVPGRDPIAFKLSGSNGSIDGPYELIAEGDIVDFAGETEWPRFTRNETPITFTNQKVYSHYEIIFPAIRGPVGGSVNSMQIAEIELIGELEAQPRALTISSTKWGSVTMPGEGSFLYVDGAQVELEAVAEQYHYFWKWTGSAVDAGKVADPGSAYATGSANTIVLMDGDYSLKANFDATMFILTASSTSGGSVVLPLEGDTHFYGVCYVPLKAEADPHAQFVNWTGSAVDAGVVDDPESPDTHILVNDHYDIMANFVINAYTLTISSTSGGSVTTPGEGAMEYDAGTEVSVEATPDEHYHFVSWTGTAVDAGKVADPSSACTTVTVEGDYTLIANFEIDKHTLTICSNNGGSVTTPGEGVFEYDYGTVVDLEATPDPDYRFKFWTGPVADEFSACTTVTITEDITVEATFVKTKPCPPKPDCDCDPDPIEEPIT